MWFSRSEMRFFKANPRSVCQISYLQRHCDIKSPDTNPLVLPQFYLVPPPPPPDSLTRVHKRRVLRHCSPQCVDLRLGGSQPVGQSSAVSLRLPQLGSGRRQLGPSSLTVGTCRRTALLSPGGGGRGGANTCDWSFTGHRTSSASMSKVTLTFQ